MKEKILITSALPYANGPLHFGHIAGAYLPGDCYARYQRLQNNDVFYVCGSDEYGIAITLNAEMAGRTPKEHVDIFHEVNRDLFKRLNFSFDHFSRTTWKGHIAPVHQYFKDLLANGYIEEKITDQLYSEKDHKFLADRYVVGTCPKCGFDPARGDECPKCGASYEATDLKNPRSKITNSPLILKPTKHWFLLLDKFKDKLLKWLETKQWKPNVTNFIRGYIENLHPRAITRDMTWGVPLPLEGTEDKVLYVWFDAPIGYISASMEWAIEQGDPELWKKYWFDQKTKLVNFIGKDNIPFHAAIFPAMTMGQNQPYKLVDELPANEFYNLEGRQFSKSDGWYIDLEDFFTRYTPDQIRYTIAANAPETSDSEFTWKDFQHRCNSELLGKFGNLVNRTLVFAKTRCDAHVPKFGELESVDREFLERCKQLIDQASESYNSFKLRRAMQIIMELAQIGNVYFDSKRPWSDAKDPSKQHLMETTIACCLECLKGLALIASPVIPEASSLLWKMLGYKTDLSRESWEKVALQRIPEGQILLEPKILFNKVEDEQIDLEIAKLKGMVDQKMEQSNQSGKNNNNGIDQPIKVFEIPPLKEAIDISEVKKLDLRVGQILQATKVPKSKKLLQMEVDLGFEKRTIVAGIGISYQNPEELIGKKIVVVANLKPATLMGVQSQGMILAGNAGDALEVVGIEHLPPGSVVS